MQWQVFIAFASADGLELARQLRAALDRIGLRAFVADDCMSLGDRTLPQIAHAQRAAEMTVVVASRSMPESGHLDTEVLRAVQQSRERGHKLVPWAIPGGAKPDEWPSGLAAYPSVHGAPDEVAVKLREALRKPTIATPSVPSAEAQKAAAAWLQERYPTVHARRALLRELDRSYDAAKPWLELIQPLDAAELTRIIREADAGQGEADTVLALIERQASIAPSASTRTERFEAELERAVGALNANDYKEALTRLDALLNITAGEEGVAEVRSRALLNKIAALNALGRHDQIDRLLDQVDPTVLSDRARTTYGRFLVSAERWDQAQQVAGRGDVVDQLLSLRRDGVVPESLVDDPEVRLSAAVVRVNEGRSATAIALAEDALRVDGLLVGGLRLAAEVIARSLYRWWVGMSSEPVPDPGTALARLRALLEGNAEEWADVELVRRLIELEPVPDPPAQDAPGEAPAWLHALQTASRPDELETIAATNASVGPVHVVLAQALRLAGRGAGAVEAARRAFGMLPGRGQRLELCRCLLLAGRRDEAAVLAAALPPVDDDTWDLHVQLAADSAERLTRARAWVERSPRQWVAWHHVLDAAMRLGRVEDARRAGREFLAQDAEARLESLRLVAAAATIGPEVDRVLALDVSRALHRHHEGDPEAESIRSQLVVMLEDPTQPPPDWNLLVESGHAWAVSVEDLADLMRDRARRAAFLDRAWNAGALCFETWAEAGGIAQGQVGVELRRRAFPVPPPVPPRADCEWRGKACLVNGLAIEVLMALDLHRAFAAEVAAVVVLEDVWARVMNGSRGEFLASWDRERRTTEAMWALVEALPTLPEENLTEAEVPAVLAWLAARGHLPPSRVEPWQPPGGAVVLASSALHELGAHLEAFLDECRRQGLRVAVGARSRRARATRAQQLQLRAEAIALATQAYHWLGELEAAGKLRVLPLPPPPSLPARRHEGSSAPEYTARTWATREALAADPTLCAVIADGSEFGLDGAVPFGLAGGLAWTPETYRAIKERYAALAGRAVTIGRVARELVPAPARMDTLGLLAAAGYVDALTGQDVVALFDTYGDLDGAKPLGQLRGMVGWARGDERLPQHALLAMHVGFRVISEVFEVLWLGEQPHADAIRATRSLLDIVERLDQESRGRFDLLAQAAEGIALRCLQHPERFVEEQHEDVVEFGSDAVAGLMWREIASWATNSARIGALRRGMTAALRTRISRSEWTCGVVCIMLITLLPRRGALDLSSSVWAAALADDEFGPELRQTSVLGQPLGAWIDAAIASDSLELDGLAIAAQVAAPTGPAREVRVPVEVAIDALGTELAQAVVRGLAPHDARVAEAAAAWLEGGSPARLSRLKEAIARSPLRAVREDARAVTSWSRYATRKTHAVRSLDTLRALLGETADDQVRSADDRLIRRWEDVSDLADPGSLLRQLGRMPGTAIGSGGRLLSHDGGPSAHDLTQIARMVEHHREYSSGSVADAIVGLAVAGATDPVRRVGDQEFELPRLAADLAAAALAGLDDKPSYATREPSLVRLCGSIVAAVGDQPVREWIWTSWRLYGWLAEQMLLGPDVGGSQLALAEAAPAPRPHDELSADLYDPRRIASGRVDLRELLVVQALVLVWEIAQDATRDGTSARIDWSRVLSSLARVAARPLTEDEAWLRERWRDPALGGRALCAPDLSRLLLLSIDRGQLWSAPPEARMRWLEDALSTTDCCGDLRVARDQVLAVVALAPERLSDAERTIWLQGLQQPALTVDSFQRRLAVIAASGFAPALAVRAREVLEASLGDDQGILLVAEWLLAQARAGSLRSAVQTVRELAAARQVDELPLLLGLSRVVMSDQRAAAAEVLTELAGEERLALGLRELIGFVNGEGRHE